MSAWASGNLAAKLKEQREKPAAAPAKKELAAAAKSPAPKAATPPPAKPKSAEATPNATPKGTAAVLPPAPAPVPAPSVTLGAVTLPESLAKYLSDDFTFSSGPAPAAPVAPVAPVAVAAAAPSAAPAAPAAKQSYARTVQPNPPQPVAAVSAPVVEQPIPVDQYYQNPQPSWQQYQSNPSANFFVPQQRAPYNNTYHNRQSNSYGQHNRYSGQAFGEIPRQYAMRQQHQHQHQHQPYYPSYEYSGGAGYQQRYGDPYTYSNGQNGMGYNGNYRYSGSRLQPLPPYYPPYNSTQQQQQQQQQQPIPPQGY